MAKKFTRMPIDTFTHLQLEAGILVDSFLPANGTIGNILGATTGGIQFQSNPTYSDIGEDVDNCPANMKELKHLDSFDPTMSGTFLTCTPAIIKSLIGAADIDAQDTTKVVPRSDIIASDFKDLWWIGDYSDANTGSTAGFLAIHLINALNQAGFQIQSSKNNKGQMAFEYHAHYSMEAQDTAPFEIFCKAGTSDADPAISLNTHTVTIAVDEEIQLIASVVNSTSTVTWTSSASTKASVTSAGVVKGLLAGSTIITAAITEGGVTYNDTCTVIVTD